MGSNALESAYGTAAMDDFRRLCVAHDPDGKFRNEWFEELIFAQRQGEEGGHLQLLHAVNDDDANIPN